MLQKYERGMNRISASKLWEIGEVLGVPPSYFFEGYKEGKPPNAEHDPMAKRETRELVRYYENITDKGIKRGLYELVKAASNR